MKNNEYQKGYNARLDGEEVNFSNSSDWLCGWYAAEVDIGK